MFKFIKNLFKRQEPESNIHDWESQPYPATNVERHELAGHAFDDWALDQFRPVQIQSQTHTRDQFVGKDDSVSLGLEAKYVGRKQR